MLEQVVGDAKLLHNPGIFPFLRGVDAVSSLPAGIVYRLIRVCKYLDRGHIPGNMAIADKGLYLYSAEVGSCIFDHSFLHGL